MAARAAAVPGHPPEAAREARPAPAGLAAPLRRVLEPRAVTVRFDGRVVLRLWPRSGEPPAAPASDPAPFRARYRILQGALVGALEIADDWPDAKGQRIPRGVYTLRYGLQPLMKEHAGTAAHRDFLVLLPARIDRSSAGRLDLEELVRRSGAVARARHPSVLELVLPAGGELALRRDGQGRTVLDVAGGPFVFAVVLATPPDRLAACRRAAPRRPPLSPPSTRPPP